jgi:ribosomal subunit interface protein
MNKRIVFRNMDHSDVMESYAHQQLKKIEEFIEHFNTPHVIDLYLEPSHVHEHHRVALHVRFGSHNLESSYEHEGQSFYDTLDRVIDVVYKRLHEEKRKIDDDKKRAGRHDDFKKER